MSSLPLPIAAFAAGLVSFLTPCVLPLVPGYISLISGAGLDELKQQLVSCFRSCGLDECVWKSRVNESNRYHGFRG
jgi:cytochrome c biogenesis protein CcdA